jgi:nucleoside-diphosphate-sugar epimerase
MGLHVVVGAGWIGAGTAIRLADAGHQVRVVTRSGSGPSHSGIECVAADAAQPGALAAIVTGADAIYNCANPRYNRWAADWPPIASALLDAAEQSGAVLVTMSNLYGYGPVDHPITEDDPLAATFTNGRVRAQMWDEAIAAHRAGRVRVTEARASDFFGPGLTDSSQLGRVIPRILASKSVRVLGNPDLAHSWTYVPDVTHALVVLGTDPRAWGHAWHVPTDAPKTQREMISTFAEIANVATPKIGSLPQFALRAVGLVSPMVRRLQEILYQVDNPFVVDSSRFESVFGVTPTPMRDALRETFASWASPVTV